ncbi:MAG: type IX secretion system membrane protein PorP/SprF [Bacteroidales bacterium]|nr:type IX secretion system membrane protein PorP/SprF [Bacteroidales bacterium]MBR7175998.1 type IX secretion system membrane protein PorP/SprF [Bacteroidales bacterium]
MHKLRYILTIIIIAISAAAVAQQAPMFTNYSNSYACVNPGFGGLSDGINVMGIYRDQWTGFKDANGNAVTPRTMLFSGDMPIKLLHGGLSLSVMNDKIAFEDNINVNLGYSFHMDLGAGTLGMGLAFSMVNRSVDFSKYEPLNPNDHIIPSGEQSDMLLDANIGLFWQIPETFYIGISATNLFESKGKNLSSSSETSSSFVGDRTFYLMAGYEYQFNNPLFVLMPTMCLMTDIASTQVNVGAKLFYNNKIWFGSNYRYQESVALMAGFKIKDIQISYSYDINTMGIAVQGSHEVCVSYLFKMNLEKSPRIYRSIRYL